jgi:hypothetical protein
LELGCGGGNNASFLKQHFQMTLTEVSPRMLDQSRHLNQECEHVTGDMRPFSERVWLRCLVGPGFEARKLPIVHSEVEPGSCDIFVGLKPACRG